jgi:nitroimidazol reductase NimA-like FMN-containing flavoprotein (pyridoxamine 5'-phosphate oxidase superfamily)
MRSNPKVWFEVDDYEGNINKWRRIILSGIAEEVNDYNAVLVKFTFLMSSTT